jgi:hypothetical protein
MLQCAKPLWAGPLWVRAQFPHITLSQKIGNKILLLAKNLKKIGLLLLTMQTPEVHCILCIHKHQVDEVDCQMSRRFAHHYGVFCQMVVESR